MAKVIDKTQLYNEFEELLEHSSKEQLLKYIFDYFNKQDLVDLKQHIEEEKENE